MKMMLSEWQARLQPERVRATLRAVHPDMWAALGVLVAALLLRLNHLDMPGNEYDEGVYMASLRSLASGHALYAQVYCGQPPLFLLSLLPWYRLFGATLFAARLGVALYSLIGLVAAWWLGRMLGGRRTGLIALALLAFDPLYLMQSRSVQAEAPALACMLLAVALAVWAWQSVGARHAASASAVPRDAWQWLASPDARQWWQPALVGAVFAAACMIKLFVLLALIPIAALLLAPDWGEMARAWLTQRQQPTRAQMEQAWHANWPTLAASAGAFILVILLIFFSQADPRAEWAQVVGLHASAAGSFGSRLDNLGTFVGMWWDFPLLLAGGYAGWLGWQLRRWPAVLFVAWGIISILALAVQVPLFPHHLALIPPPFILAAALLPGLMQGQTEQLASERARHEGQPQALGGSGQPCGAGRRQPQGIAPTDHLCVSSLILATLLGIAFITSLVQQNTAAQHPPTDVVQMANDVSVLTQPDDLVVTDDQMIAVLAGREVPAPLVDTSGVRIASGALTTRQVMAVATDPRVTAIVWYSGRFDHLPGLRSWVTHSFIRAIDYGNGRALYLRVPPTTGPAKG